MSLGCCRGLVVLVPVPATCSERLNGMICVPVPFGSKNGSPVGTEMSNGSRGLAPVVRSMSWSMNWPQA